MLPRSIVRLCGVTRETSAVPRAKKPYMTPPAVQSIPHSQSRARQSSFMPGAIPLADPRQDPRVRRSLFKVSVKERQLTFPEVFKCSTGETVSLPGIPQKRHIDACPL